MEPAILHLRLGFCCESVTHQDQTQQLAPQTQVWTYGIAEADALRQGACVSGWVLSEALLASGGVAGTCRHSGNSLFTSHGANCVDTFSPRNFSFCLVSYLSKLWVHNSGANCFLIYKKQLSCANLSIQFLLSGGNPFQCSQLYVFFFSLKTYLIPVIY